MSIQEEKIAQAVSIMEELGIDMWITLVRESDTITDPVLELILARNVTWQSAFILTRGGERIAIVGSLDEPSIRDTGLYTTVKSYVASLKEALLETIVHFDPSNIALNFPSCDVHSAGLTNGMSLVLNEYLEGTPYPDRLISSRKLISALRGRKSDEELGRIAGAVEITEEILEKLTEEIRPGLSEKDIARLIMDEVAKRELEPAWDTAHCPAVFTGPESAGAHYSPTDRKIKPGHILNVDFGVLYREYCSDMQRTWYIRREGEENAPAPVAKGFETVRDAVRRASETLSPGIEGWKVDEVARTHITSLGYDEYPHALGHQIGRKAHDGAGLLCPRWERYGKLPYEKVERGQVYTLEPRVTVEGYGVATVEEIAVVEEDGCRFLSHPQNNLYTI